MPPALGADPELVGRPRLAGAWIAHVHLRAAALAADLKGVAHAAILLQGLRRVWQWVSSSLETDHVNHRGHRDHREYLPVCAAVLSVFSVVVVKLKEHGGFPGATNCIYDRPA
jgi:hypothetical protein